MHKSFLTHTRKENLFGGKFQSILECFRTKISIGMISQQCIGPFLHIKVNEKNIFNLTTTILDVSPSLTLP